MQNDTPTLASDARLFFAEQVKKARQKLGETQTEFANRFGVATNTISRYETGLYQPSDEIILTCLIINNKLKDDTPATLQHANKAIKHLTQVIDELTNKLATELERQQNKLAVTENTSDGYHTFKELYEFRKLYNAALFNEWAAQGKYHIHKSERHSDGELCFGGGWFIVVAQLPTGQISNHYELKDWDLFQCAAKEKADDWDGHTEQDVIERLKSILKAEMAICHQKIKSRTRSAKCTRH